MSNGEPFTGQMLGWCQKMLYRTVDAYGLDRAWVKRAVVTINWTWLGKDYGFENVGVVETEASTSSVTVRNTQSPLPSSLRTEP